jgi:hypothetical protein
MGVSAIGQRISATTIRHVAATITVFVAVFYFFYGPPLTPRLSDAAHRACNHLVRSDYRSYRLEWRTTTYAGISRPHWVCVDLSRPDRRSHSLGWWVGT